jgi:hypothetical protein
MTRNSLDGRIPSGYGDLVPTRKHIPIGDAAGVVATTGVHSPRVARAFAALLLLLLPLASCHKASPLQPSTGVYDFSLVDVNPNSATYGQTVSRSDFVGKPLVLFIGAAT